MPAHSVRLGLPLGDYIGARGPGTIKTIRANTFQDVDDALPGAVGSLMVVVNNSPCFINNELVYL
jgi:hypothetical protein